MCIIYRQQERHTAIEQQQDGQEQAPKETKQKKKSKIRRLFPPIWMLQVILFHPISWFPLCEHPCTRWKKMKLFIEKGGIVALKFSESGVGLFIGDLFSCCASHTSLTHHLSHIHNIFSLSLSILIVSRVLFVSLILFVPFFLFSFISSSDPPPPHLLPLIMSSQLKDHTHADAAIQQTLEDSVSSTLSSSSSSSLPSSTCSVPCCPSPSPCPPPSVTRPLVYSGGRQGAKPYQEDSFFSWCSPHNMIVIGGVLDGHGGYNGMQASGIAKQHCISFLQQNDYECEGWNVEKWINTLKLLFDSMHEAIRNAFMTAPVPPTLAAFTQTKPGADQRWTDEMGVVRNGTADPIHGGTTATITVMIQEEKGRSATLITANVGDSTAIVVPTRGTWDFLSVVIYLS